MTPKTTHWTESSTDAFRYRVANDFVVQLEKRMELGRISQKTLASRLHVSEGRVSQVLNNPTSLTLKSIIDYARALGMKVAVVAYDDNDPTNTNGPITPEIFQACWEKLGSPRDFFELEDSTQTRTVVALETFKFPRPEYVSGEGSFSINFLNDPDLSPGVAPVWQTDVTTPARPKRY